MYGQALETQTKLTQAREARDAEVRLNAQASSRKMTWVSKELTKGRNTGEYSNYGERLYVEGMLDNEKKKAAVGYCQTATSLLCSTFRYESITKLVNGERAACNEEEGEAEWGCAVPKDQQCKRQTAV